jgi:hypothetical protein
MSSNPYIAGNQGFDAFLQQFPGAAGQQTQQAADQAATAAANGVLNFGNGAFPNATQAAFGLGGQGVGYGGSATGGTISFPSSSGGYTQQAAAPAGSAGGMNWVPILIIGGLLLLAVLVIGGGGEEIEEALGGGHRRRRRRS